MTFILLSFLSSSPFLPSHFTTLRYLCLPPFATAWRRVGSRAEHPCRLDWLAFPFHACVSTQPTDARRHPHHELLCSGRASPPCASRRPAPAGLTGRPMPRLEGPPPPLARHLRTPLSRRPPSPLLLFPFLFSPGRSPATNTPAVVRSVDCVDPTSLSPLPLFSVHLFPDFPRRARSTSSRALHAPLASVAHCLFFHTSHHPFVLSHPRPLARPFAPRHNNLRSSPAPDPPRPSARPSSSAQARPSILAARRPFLRASVSLAIASSLLPTARRSSPRGPLPTAPPSALTSAFPLPPRCRLSVNLLPSPHPPGPFPAPAPATPPTRTSASAPASASQPTAMSSLCRSVRRSFCLQPSRSIHLPCALPRLPL